MIRRHHRRSFRRRRRGYALVIFALIFFCLMALGALVIDIGLARMTQRQMQTAVDSAALEGLRGRDVNSTDPTNAIGRSAAQQIIRQTFDDDFDLDQDVRYFGAGPVYNLGPSIGTDSALGAGQLLTIDPAKVYKPLPVANADNAEHGDFVAGNYTRPNDAVAIEQPDYSRNDFTAAQGGDAFLARLRRSNNFQGFDNVGNVSQAGPALPFLFGRGSLIHKDHDRANPNGYSPREHGLTVRATAIAQARRTLSIGRRPFEADATFGGALPLFLNQTNISDLQTGSALTISGSDVLVNTQAIGSIYDSTISDGLGLAWSLGDIRPAPVAGITAQDIHFAAAQRTQSDDSVRFGYVPVIGVVTGSSDQHVIGFTAIQFTYDATNDSLLYTVLTNFIAPENTSPTLAHELPLSFVGAMPTANAQDLLDSQSAIPESLRLLTAALVR